MKKIIGLFFFLTILSLSSLWIFNYPKPGEYSRNKDHVKLQHDPYFFPLPITKFTASNQPCLMILVDDFPVNVMLDLGFRGQFSFSPIFLGQIKNKKFISSKKMYGIRGGEYLERLYLGPKIKIGPVSFSEPILHEQADKFYLDSTLIKKEGKPSVPEIGKIGWELFGNINLFLDLGNSKIAFCDSIDTIKKQGYALNKLVKSPLLLERGLIEFEAATLAGKMRCMLDTGSTWNILNTEDSRYRSAEGVIPKLLDEINCDSFKIGEVDLGSITFHSVPIKIPIHIEAILGMEFFEKHRVFIDFLEKQVYFF